MIVHVAFLFYFFCLFFVSGFVLFPLPQSATLTKAMQIAGVQSLDLKWQIFWVFSSLHNFFLNRGSFYSWSFSLEEGVGPPPLNHTPLAPATDLHMPMPQL